MTTLRTARMLTRYNAWADKLIFEAVAALPHGEAIKPRTTLFKNIVHMLNHIYVIDRVFQAHLEGRQHGYAARNTPDHPPLDDLWRAQQALDDWYIAWSDGITAAAAQGVTVYAPVPNPKTDRDPAAACPGDSPAVVAWRTRMATAEAKAIDKARECDARVAFSDRR